MVNLTIPPILIKQQSPLPLIHWTQKKMTTAYDVWNPYLGMGQAQKCVYKECSVIMIIFAQSPKTTFED